MVVTGAGAVYYLSDSRRGTRPAESSSVVEEKKKQSKKDRRKAKKQAEEGNKEVTPKTVTEPGTSNQWFRTATANRIGRGNCEEDGDCGNRR